MMKRALGRGLGALLPPADAPGDASRLRDLPIESLIANPQQPRKDFDEQALEELAQSIRSSGILQPLVVRPRGAQFEILVGERRWRAAQRAGLAQVPAIVREASDAEALELALVENLLREDLNPVEAAQAYQRLLAEFGWTQEELAKRIGKAKTPVAAPPPEREAVKRQVAARAEARLRDAIAIRSKHERYAAIDAVEKDVLAQITTPFRQERVELASLEQIEARQAEHRRLGGVTKQGNRYLRSLLTVGALAVIRFAQRHGTKRPWIVQLLARRATKVAAVALANKMARMVWALMAKGEHYREPVVAQAA